MSWIGLSCFEHVEILYQKLYKTFCTMWMVKWKVIAWQSSLIWNKPYKENSKLPNNKENKEIGPYTWLMLLRELFLNTFKLKSKLEYFSCVSFKTH